MINTNSLPPDDENPDTATVLQSARETAERLHTADPVGMDRRAVPDIHTEDVVPGGLTPKAAAPIRRLAGFAHNPASIANTYAPALAAGSVTEDQVSLLTWLCQIAKIEHFSLGDIAKKLGYSSATTISRIFSGDYGADLANVIEKITHFKALYEARAQVGKTVIAETSVVQSICQFLDFLRAHGAMGAIYGESQTGKSTAAKWYAGNNNHGRTPYVRTPTGGSVTKFQEELGISLGITHLHSTSLYRQPFKLLNDQKLLIIDEFHQTRLNSVAGRGGVRVTTTEYIRELHERTGVAIAVIATPIMRKEIEEGRHSGVLEQFRRWSIEPLVLPSVLPRKDLDLIAAPYGLPPADDETHALRSRIIKATGLRAYTTYLRSGSTIASKRSSAMDWRYFTAAHDILAGLSTAKAR